MSQNATTVVVVDDEASIRRFLRASLAVEGFRVLEAVSAKEALRTITQERPDLILLDLGLPDGDGVDVIREVRGWTAVPIIVLSARGEEQSKILALDAGADDYLTKPFSVGELLARIRVSMRHAARGTADQESSGTFTCGRLEVNLPTRQVLLAGQEVKLTKLEFDLLTALIRHGGKVVTHRQLLKEVWGPHAVHEPHYVRVFVASLRKKLEQNPARPEFLLTEQGVGYRLKIE
jgi:two-component system, OmpR family, KDP operon response regulator KdpE